MIPEECRECWDPECMRHQDVGDVTWDDFRQAGVHCPFFVPSVNALKPCPCCGQDLAMLDTLESTMAIFVWCQNCGTTTNAFESVEDAVKAWNAGEVT